MDKRTTIQIENSTLQKLKNLKITKKETYDEILNRMIKEFKILKKVLIQDSKTFKNIIHTPKGEEMINKLIGG